MTLYFEFIIRIISSLFLQAIFFFFYMTTDDFSFRSPTLHAPMPSLKKKKHISPLLLFCFLPPSPLTIQYNNKQRTHLRPSTCPVSSEQFYLLNNVLFINYMCLYIIIKYRKMNWKNKNNNYCFVSSYTVLCLFIYFLINFGICIHPWE